MPQQQQPQQSQAFPNRSGQGYSNQSAAIGGYRNQQSHSGGNNGGYGGYGGQYGGFGSAQQGQQGQGQNQQQQQQQQLQQQQGGAIQQGQQPTGGAEVRKDYSSKDLDLGRGFF